MPVAAFIASGGFMLGHLLLVYYTYSLKYTRTHTQRAQLLLICRRLLSAQQTHNVQTGGGGPRCS